MDSQLERNVVYIVWLSGINNKSSIRNYLRCQKCKGGSYFWSRL